MSGPYTPSSGTPPTTPTNTLAARIREIGNLKGVSKKRATVKRTTEKVKTTVEEKVQRVKEVLSGHKSELDYLRRHTRLVESIALARGNPALKEAADAAELALKRLPPPPVPGEQPRVPVPDWAAPYVELGRVADELLAAGQLAEDRQKQAAKSPSTAAMMEKIRQAQETLELRRVPSEQHKSYSGVFKQLSLDVVNLVGVTVPSKVQVVSQQVDGAVAALSHVMRAAQELLDRLTGVHDGLAKKLAALGQGDDTADQRLAVAQLLQAGLAAARAYDEGAATGKFEEARVLLGDTVAETFQAQAVQTELDAPGGLKKRIHAIRRDRGLATRKEASDQALRLQADIENLEFRLRKGGDEVAGDVKRLMKVYEGQCLQLEKALRYDPDTVGKGLIAEFAQTCQPIEQAASDHYERLGAKSGYEGKFHGDIAALKQRLADNVAKAVSADDVHFAELLKELEAVRKAIELAAGQTGKGGTEPREGELRYQAAVVKFDVVIRQLDTQAEAVIGEDSDLATRLGLLTAPATLRREGEALARSEPAPDGYVAAAQSLEGVNTRIESKLLEISKAPRATPPTADQLRTECQQLRTGYDQRLQATLLLVTTDQEKNFVTRELKTDQLEGLIKMAAELGKRLKLLAAPAADGASADKALLLQTRTALQGFEAEVKKYEEMGPGPKHVKGRKHFSDITEQVDKLLKLLDDTRFGPRGDVTGDWKTTLELLKKSPSKRDPDAVWAELLLMKGEIDAALITAKAEHEKAEQEIAAVQKLWDLSAFPTDQAIQSKAATYTKAFAQFGRDCEQAIENLKASDQPDEGLLSLLHERYKKLTTGTNTELDQLEAPALKAEEAYQRALTNLRQLLEVDIRLLREKAKLLTGTAAKGMTEQIDSAEKAAKVAVDNLKKSYDATQAEAMIDAITLKLRQIEDSPQGSRTSGRNQFGAVCQRWKSTVALVHEKLDQLPAAVGEACKQDPAVLSEAGTIEGKLRSTLVQGLKQQLQADAFDAVAQVMANGSERDRLEAREEGLAEVRRLRRVMMADGRFRQAGPGCPFPKARVSFRTLDNVLLDLETNLNINDTATA